MADDLYSLDCGRQANREDSHETLAGLNVSLQKNYAISSGRLYP